MLDAAPPDGTSAVDWAVAGTPMPGEHVSGDIHAVVPIRNGILAAVADGLGHGPEAALAAEVAAETVKAYAEHPVATIVARCHEALRRTRGVALSLASLNTADDTMMWIGIGNVEGALFRASPAAKPRREVLLLRGGVVGYSLPRPLAAKLPVHPGDTLVLATDGIRSLFKQEETAGGPAQSLATDLLLRHARDTDDALVLVVRYIGTS